MEFTHSPTDEFFFWYFIITNTIGYSSVGFRFLMLWAVGLALGIVKGGTEAAEVGQLSVHKDWSQEEARLVEHL